MLVALSVASRLVGWNLVFTFTVYAEPLVAAFGLSSLRVSSVFSVTAASFFVVGGTAELVSARLRLRPVVAMAGLAIAIGVGLIQAVDAYLWLIVAFGLLGAAGFHCGPGPG